MDWSSRSANAYWVLSQLPLCCPFTNAFEHVLGRHAKQEADNHILTACLIAWATNMGLGRMGEISDISFHTLVSASDNFIRPETSREANDRISNAIAKLPIFRHYDLDDALHSSSDGQKFETSIHTLNARHSYFGLKKRSRFLHSGRQQHPDQCLHHRSKLA